MRIDAHGHAVGYYATLEKLLEKMEQNKLDKVVLFPGDTGNEKITHLSDGKNKEVLSLSNRFGEFFARFMNISKKIDFGNHYVHYLQQLRPDRIIQFYWLTPAYLETFKTDFTRMQIKGIKLHQCIRYFKIDSDFFRSVLDFAEEKNLPVILHLFAKKDALQLIKILKGRKVKVIVSHLLFYKEFIPVWEDLKQNIFFDIASYYFINPSSLQEAIDKFGCEKLIYGSDSMWGVDCIEKTLEMVQKLPLPDTQKELILGENMRKILGI